MRLQRSDHPWTSRHWLCRAALCTGAAMEGNLGSCRVHRSTSGFLFVKQPFHRFNNHHISADVLQPPAGKDVWAPQCEAVAVAARSAGGRWSKGAPWWAHLRLRPPPRSLLRLFCVSLGPLRIAHNRYVRSGPLAPPARGVRCSVSSFLRPTSTRMGKCLRRGNGLLGVVGSLPARRQTPCRPH